MAETLPMVVIRRTGGKDDLPARSEYKAAVRREFDLAGDDGPGAGASAAAAVRPTIEAQKEELTSEQARVRAAEHDVYDVIPALPFKLPTPVGATAPLAALGTEGPDEPPLKASWGIAAVGAEEAPPIAGRNVIVAVLDSGIVQDEHGEISHAAFKDLNIVFKNFTNEAGDAIGHGTHTAATIFGRDVDQVRIGIARGVQTALIGKILAKGQTCTTDTILKAMHWALSEGAHVINMSLGVDFVGYREYLVKERRFPSAKATSIALAGYRLNIRLFDRLSMLLATDERGFGGSFVVAAAGNESARPDYTITTAPPAAGEKFFAVAAVDSALAVAPFSNDDVDIAAPGVDILSAALDGGLRLDSGTSMAAPHVAGVATLYAEAMIRDNTFSAAALERKLRDNVKPIASLPRDVGSGLVHWVADA